MATNLALPKEHAVPWDLGSQQNRWPWNGRPCSLRMKVKSGRGESIHWVTVFELCPFNIKQQQSQCWSSGGWGDRVLALCVGKDKLKTEGG